jgi:tetratricopeptide (TPR) repeat protein
LLKQVGNKTDQPSLYEYFGNILYLQCDYERAKTLYNKSLSMWVSMGNTANIAELVEKLGEVALRQDQLLEAKALFCESLELLRSVERRAFKVAICLFGLAQIADAEEQPERFVTLLGASEAHRNLTPTNYYSDRREENRLKTKLRFYLDKPSFINAYNNGLSMTKEQAIDFALSECNFRECT